MKTRTPRELIATVRAALLELKCLGADVPADCALPKNVYAKHNKMTEKEEAELARLANAWWPTPPGDERAAYWADIVAHVNKIKGVAHMACRHAAWAAKQRAGK